MSTVKKVKKFWIGSKDSPIKRWAFSKALGLLIPYSGGIKPFVHKIENGESIVSIKDCRRIRNHLGSIHAIALANLGELASGLAMISKLPDEARGIVKGLEIDFLKKARGPLIAKGFANPPEVIEENIEQITSAQIFDANNEMVAEIKVNWQVGPEQSRAKQ